MVTKQRIIKLVKGVFLAAIMGLSALYVFQEELIFFPQPVSAGKTQHIKELGDQVEEIHLTMKDGTKLHGWFAKNKQADKLKTVVYFGGNGDELSYMVDRMNKFAGWSVVFVNYRGYGLSEGKPSEKNFYSDALEIYDYFDSRIDIDSKKLVVMGRSLGTGVATYVAANRNTAGVILVSPYDKLSSPGKEAYPYLPVETLLKHKFDSISRAPTIKAPLLMLVAAEDITVLPQFSKRLAQKWGGPVALEEIKGTDHDSILEDKELWRSIGSFLKEK